MRDGLYEKVHMSPGALIWSLVVGLFDTNLCVGSHRTSVSAILVPLEERYYNHTGKCSLSV